MAHVGHPFLHQLYKRHQKRVLGGMRDEQVKMFVQFGDVVRG
ncbi:hypothetical protein ACVWY0_002482 [Arthrobacter sp. UYNi723]